MKRLLCTALCLLPGAVFAQAQDTPKPEQPKMYKLREVFQPGDVGTLDEGFQIKMAVQARMLDLESPMITAVNHQESNYQLAVLAVDAKGRPTAERMSVSRLRSTIQVPGQKAQTHTATVEGKTATVKRSGSKTVVTVDRGSISSMDRKWLADSLGNEAETPFPDYDVLMGEEWTVESKELARSFGSEGTANVTGKVVEELQRAGHPCVRVTMHIDGNGWRQAGSMTISTTLDGEVIYALDLKRTLSVSLSGPVTVTGDLTNGQVPVSFGGDGTATMHFSTQWSRIAGKPVQPVQRGAAAK